MMTEIHVKRVFVGGLFNEITEKELVDKFDRFGTVDGIEIKHKRSADGQVEKTFAYINLKTSEANLQKCFSIFNKSKWKGSQLCLQQAKEDFIQRLKKERENGFKIEGTRKMREKNTVHNVLENAPGVENYTMKGASPGTLVPGAKNWVVGKHGYVEPVVYLRRKDRRKVMKVDPSQFLKNHRSVAASEDIADTDTITWEMDEKNTDIVKKQKGEFPEWHPKQKNRKLLEHDDTLNRSKNDDFEIVKETRTWDAHHSGLPMESDSDSDYSSMKQKLLPAVGGSPVVQQVKNSNLSVTDSVKKRSNTEKEKKGGNPENVKKVNSPVFDAAESVMNSVKRGDCDSLNLTNTTKLAEKQFNKKVEGRQVVLSLDFMKTGGDQVKRGFIPEDNDRSECESVSSADTDEIIRKTRHKAGNIQPPLSGQLKPISLDEYSSGIVNGDVLSNGLSDSQDDYDDDDDDSLDEDNYENLARKIENEYRTKHKHDSKVQLKKDKGELNTSESRSAGQPSIKEKSKGKANTKDQVRRRTNSENEAENKTSLKSDKKDSISDVGMMDSRSERDSESNSEQDSEQDSERDSDSDTLSEELSHKDGQGKENVTRGPNHVKNDQRDTDLGLLKDSSDNPTDVKVTTAKRGSISIRNIPVFKGTKDLYASDLKTERKTCQSTMVTENKMSDKTKDNKGLNPVAMTKMVGSPVLVRDKDQLREESNLKRLESIKQRKMETQGQKSVIKEALSLVDKSSTPNKRIVFDSDSDDDESDDKSSTDSSSSSSCVSDSSGSSDSDDQDEKESKKPALFESSSDDDKEDDSNDDGSKSDDENMFRIRPQFEGKAGQKLIQLQSRYKNDDRFKLDERFQDVDEEEGEMKDQDVSVNLPVDEDERLRSLKILKEVVGNKATIRVEKDTKNKKMFKDMSALHFDPSREDHIQFEVQTPKENDKDNSEKKNKKKKKQKIEDSKEMEEEEELPEVSKERFYEVTSSFKDTFSDQHKSEDISTESFSLLKAFGHGTDTGEGESDVDEAEQAEKLIPSKEGEFLWQQPFKYDSSDSDDEKEEMETDQLSESGKPAQSVVVFGTTPTSFFFGENDERIQDGVQAFHRQNDVSVIREKWLKGRQQLVDNYRTKHKRLVRKKKQTDKFRHQYQK